MKSWIQQKNKPLITLERVTLRIGNRMILPGTSWKILTGENWAILGPNGSGKSALARAIQGDCPYVRGKMIRHDPEAEGKKIGYVSFELLEEILAREEFREEERFFSGKGKELTAGESLRKNVKDPTALKRIAEILDIRHLLGHRLRALSNGESRKLLIARALLNLPKILILDDPFAGLDTNSRPLLASAITNLMQEGMQIIIVAQRPEELIPGISHVLLIRNGRVTLKGKREDVLTTNLMNRLNTTKRAFPKRHIPFPDPTSSARSPDGHIIEMINVYVAFGDYVVLNDLNWTVRNGENWAVVGPNGSGKTTLLSLITGDNLQVYANDVRLFGKRRGEGESVWEIRRRIGLVSPEFQFRYRKAVAVREVVISGFFDSIGLYRKPYGNQILRAESWLEILGMANRADRPFNQLSYGERRLVLIARAMVKSPEILILDEPCQGLDAENRQIVLSLMEEIGTRTPTSLIYVTHHEDEMLPCIDHILRLDKRPAEGGRGNDFIDGFEERFPQGDA